MRDILNLKALKHSKNKKHETIYKKAHTIMLDGFETEELNEDEVLKLASKYPQLEVRVVIGGDILVRSMKDKWIIRDEGRFISLYHKTNIIRKGKTKESLHIQDVFYDLDFTLASIISHDEFKIKGIARSTSDINNMVQERSMLNLS